MRTRNVLVASILPVSIALLFSVSANAQTMMSRSPQVAAPDYGSSASSGFLSNTHFNTPESDGRPGVKFFAEGMAAYSQHDIRHAINRLELSAYWAYGPAAYNLGILYFKGEGGFSVDRPLGTAWMFIAAENGSLAYENARHLMVMRLDDAERTEALKDYQRLQKKYGHEVVMRRAKVQWNFAKSTKTGSRVGGEVGNLKVGLHDGNGSYAAPGGFGEAGALARRETTSFQVLNGASEDGSVAYQQMQESSNPYDLKFLKNRTGTATVGPLQRANKSTATQATKPAKSSAPAGQSDSNPQRDRGTQP
jgi:hypothetical protein